MLAFSMGWVLGMPSWSQERGCDGTDPSRFLSVPTWSIRASETFRFTASATVNPGVIYATELRAAVQTITVEGLVRQVERDEESAEWKGEGTLTLSIQDQAVVVGSIETLGWDMTSASGSADRRVRAEFWMAVDAERNTFELQVRALQPIPVTERNEAGETITRMREEVYLGVREPLPRAGLLIEGLLAKTKPVTNPFGTAGGSRDELTRWTLTPRPAEDIDCWIVPFPGYAEWMPNPLGRGLAREVPIRAEVVGKPGKKLNKNLCQLVFTMADTSREPGLCLNKEAPEGPDAEFLPGAGIMLSNENQQAVLLVAQGKREGEVRVKVHDFGAWTRIKVVALFDDGTSKEAEVKTHGGPALQLPLDDNGNHIADAWEKEHGVMGKAATDDDEATEGNENHGDGLSAYEEYRGLLIGGTHTRDLAPQDGRKPLSPKHRDLVVVDLTEGVAKPGYAQFQRLAKVTTLVVSPSDLPPDILVNRFGRFAHLGGQHGLKVETTAEAPDRTHPTWAGATVAKSGSEVPKSPGGTEVILIAPEFLRVQVANQFKEGTPPYTFADQLAETVAHELGHGVGVPHHGEARTGHRSSFVTTAATVANRVPSAEPGAAWPFHDWKVGPFHPREVTLIPEDGDIGKVPCEASGDIHCVMTYRQTPQWAQHYDVRRDAYTFYHVVPFPVGDRFCISAEGTVWNATGNRVPSFFGDAQKDHGACFGRIRIRDF